MKNLFRRIYRSKENITKEELKEMFDNNPNVILLDVRKHKEYEEGHLDRCNKYTIIWLIYGSTKSSQK